MGNIIDESTQKSFVTEDGVDVPPKNVAFKGKDPFLMYKDEKDGEHVVTDVPLLEKEITMSPEEDDLSEDENKNEGEGQI